MSAGETHPRVVLLVTGRIRGGSTNTAALRSVADPGGGATATGEGRGYCVTKPSR
jgi:hypothetical protein